MDTSKLKPFAQEARRTLKAQVSARLDQVLADQSAARREQPKAVAELEAEIAKTDRDQVVERVAYTWFNRFTALRFMDANGYTRLKVVSPADGQTRPEILAEAAAGNIDDEAPADVRAKVAALLDGRTPSADGQGEAYRLLLVAACNQWHAPMPFMFEKIADYTELLLPEDLLSTDSLLSKTRAVMTDEACQDVEIIGWLYQFYISEKKDEVFAGLKKNKKITAENIPAATQLFTPHWIVRYLVENSLGRLWLLNKPASKLAAQMDYYIAPEEPEADFLRISKPEEIRICDPACGSGHMLTYAFDLLYAIYEEEGYEATEIPALILAHNLHGIEIDDRAGALAAFALTMKAATKLGRRRFLRQAVQPNICVLQDVRFTPSEMQDVAGVVGSDLFTVDFRETMGQFEQAKNFGSLIVPKLRDPAEVARVVRLKDFDGDLLLREVQERVIKALEMSVALSPKYHVVVANPPYMGGRGMNEQLSSFAKLHYADEKADLYGAFLRRAMTFLLEDGYWALVTMESWLFLSSFENLRRDVIIQNTPICTLHMPYSGRGGTSMGINFGTVAMVAANRKFSAKSIFHCVSHYETDHFGVPKSFPPINERTSKIDINRLLNIPNAPIAYWISESVQDLFERQSPMSAAFDARQGMSTSDNPRFVRFWWEPAFASTALSSEDDGAFQVGKCRWAKYNKAGEYRRWFGNSLHLLWWRNDGQDIKSLVPRSVLRASDRYFQKSVSWSDYTTFKISFRMYDSGFIFDTGAHSAFPVGDEKLDNLLYYTNSKPFELFADLVNPTMHFHAGNMLSLPFVRVDESFRSSLARLPELAREDWNDYETSWDFTVLALVASEHRGETLAASYRNLRKHWQAMTDEMQQLEEQNNRIFISACGLEREVTPEVPLEEITLTCNPAYSLKGDKTSELREAELLARTIEEFLHYAVGCMFGRYSLDAPGLILANQGQGLVDYLTRVPAPTFEPDADNVIPVLGRDWFADDITERFRKFLRVTFGEDRFAENLAFIEEALGKDVRKYFTRDFFNDHVKRYKKRPIYWMFSSPKGSFQALIYMHRYQSDTVSVVLNDYLREFRNKLEAHRKSLDAITISPDATPTQQTKAEKEIGDVTKVIAELDEYERDILYPLATQKIEIDLDDGVKANYPKFGAALKPIKGLSDADD